MVAELEAQREIQLQEQLAERAPKVQPLAPLEASDREDAITDWLDSHGLGEGWQLPVTQANTDHAGN